MINIKLTLFKKVFDTGVDGVLEVAKEIFLKILNISIKYSSILMKFSLNDQNRVYVM